MFREVMEELKGVSGNREQSRVDVVDVIDPPEGWSKPTKNSKRTENLSKGNSSA